MLSSFLEKFFKIYKEWFCDGREMVRLSVFRSCRQLYTIAVRLLEIEAIYCHRSTLPLRPSSKMSFKNSCSRSSPSQP